MAGIADPVVGVASLIIHDGRLLLGYRQKSPGKNSWQCPGGLLRGGESVLDCAMRETEEETGLIIHDLIPGPYTNNYFIDDAFHSVTLYVRAKTNSDILKPGEIELAKDWAWFRKDNLPDPLFLPLQLLIKDYPAFWDRLF